MNKEQYTRLTLVEDLGVFVKEGTKTKIHYVKCLCDCGNEVIVPKYKFDKHITKSCGCLQREVVSTTMRKQNYYEVFNNIVFVKFTNCNEYFICDLDDWEILKKYTWFKNKDGYAVTNIPKIRIMQYFHRIVIECDDKHVVDHIKRISDGNVCDNRKSNLRVVTRCENIWNSKISSANTSGYKGVSWSKTMNKWEVRIMANGNYFRLGYFDNLEDAIIARKEGEIKYYGEIINQCC